VPGRSLTGSGIIRFRDAGRRHWSHGDPPEPHSPGAGWSHIDTHGFTPIPAIRPQDTSVQTDSADGRFGEGQLQRSLILSDEPGRSLELPAYDDKVSYVRYYDRILLLYQPHVPIQPAERLSDEINVRDVVSPVGDVVDLLLAPQ
jgi:hypothetical protein